MSNYSTSSISFWGFVWWIKSYPIFRLSSFSICKGLALANLAKSGKILANTIVQTKPNGIIAVCGNANNNELNTSVIPFMLRGIKLWGMDSANCSIKRREFIWSEASKLIDFDLLEKSILTVSLEELIETYPKILKGEISGRVIVDLNK